MSEVPAQAGPRLRLSDQPHHDGSELYRTVGPHRLGDRVTLRLRVPVASAAGRVRVRTTADAEPVMIEATASAIEAGHTWWSADLDLHNPVTSYRFLLEGGAIGYAWLHEAGLSHRDVADAWDFQVSVHDDTPAWLPHAVGYQIFLDRFARSGGHRPTPAWAVPEAWDAPLSDDPDIGTRQFFGGDLNGIEQHLDHLARLGVDLIYLTPFFPAESAHRYDASSFDTVDPLLGGDVALASLTAAAHRRGMRVIGDITLNHTGRNHDWFRTAQHDRAAAEAGFYMFGESSDDYVSWHDVPSLPKLDHRSGELARRLHHGPASVIAKYLDAPFELDGWRVDCANTTARHADIDVNHRVASETRATIDQHIDDGWLLAEHCYDAAGDLDGSGWHGVMAYQWFTRPLWGWLRGDRPFSMMSQIDVPRLDGPQVVASMRELGGTISWSARNASMTMLDSHDSARFRTAVGGDAQRHVVGLAALLTMPGVPTLFAGSEVGVEGDSMDTCRVPFPWDESTWDRDTFDSAQALIDMRSASPALRQGSFRWLDATADTLTFVREVPSETVVVHLRRTGGAAHRVELSPQSSVAQIDEPLFGPPPVAVNGGSADGSTIEFAGTIGATVVRI